MNTKNHCGGEINWRLNRASLSHLLFIKIIRSLQCRYFQSSNSPEGLLSRQRSAHWPELTLVGDDLKDTIESLIVAQQSMDDRRR